MAPRSDARINGWVEACGPDPGASAAVDPAIGPRSPRKGSEEEPEQMLSVIDALPPDPLAGFDLDRAHREGWTLTETPEFGTPEVQLQCLSRDELPSGIATLLPSDQAAWDVVVARAASGSSYHRDALRRLGQIERFNVECVFGPL